MPEKKINIIIVGAGDAGQLVASGLQKDKQSPFTIVGFVDDDPRKAGKQFQTLPVLGVIDDLKELVVAHQVRELLIAIPSERGKTIRRIVEGTIGLKLVYKILPRMSEVLLQDFSQDYLRYIRKVRIEDLLGGVILKSEQAAITDYVRGQTIMITGAAGSIGSELSRQVTAHSAKRIIFYDWWENGMFELRNELLSRHPDADLEFIIGDVKDRSKLDQIIKRYKPDAVFHAAAYKHVPLMEMNAAEAVMNNIIGTKTVAEVAIKYRVKKFVLISTDKAVNPSNVMGATKRSAEMVIHILAESQPYTKFCAVRFGNVINSNGSAIPTFQRQIEQGGPVGVTHKEMTRFFMTIPEAAHLVLQAWMMGENNDLFVLDMGEEIKIYDMVRMLIAIAGYVPEKDIKVKFIGLRPGEKLYEEVLVNEEQAASTALAKVFRTKNYLQFDRLAFLLNLSLLLELIQDDSHELEDIKAYLLKMVPTYQPASHPINKKLAA